MTTSYPPRLVIRAQTLSTSSSDLLLRQVAAISFPPNNVRSLEIRCQGLGKDWIIDCKSPIQRAEIRAAILAAILGLFEPGDSVTLSAEQEITYNPPYLAERIAKAISPAPAYASAPAPAPAPAPACYTVEIRPGEISPALQEAIGKALREAMEAAAGPCKAR